MAGEENTSTESHRTGRLYGVGLGPGDPELITLKALRVIREVPVVAYPMAKHGQSNARAIVSAELKTHQIELPMVYPITTEPIDQPGGYEGALSDFYDQMAEQVACHLEQGRDVAILCEGDPFFYGSYMYLHDRLAHRYPTEVIPGVSSIMGASARLGTPLVRRDSELTVLPATLSEDILTARLKGSGSFAIIKLGRNFAKVKSALTQTGLESRSLFIERATMPSERILPLSEVDPQNAAYFSLILVPDRGSIAHPEEQPTPRKGRIAIVGLGPGSPEWLTPEAARMLAEATDIVGYQTYLDRVPARPGQNRYGSDNRAEAARARHALTLAASGRQVCIVSSGDPGIFAMAAAVMEVLETGPECWRSLEIHVVPGLSAMQAAAARAGAPLGHDFCVLSLSDRLKPWEIIARRLHAVAAADLALAFYNPISSERQWQLTEACSILAQYRKPETPVVLARSVGRSDERIITTELGCLDPSAVDMQTVILVGSSTTRAFSLPNGRRIIYTPRTYEMAAE